jgi:hypothetical protein
MESPSHAFFEAVVNRDYDMLSGLYAMNARNAIMSFLSMRSRWSTAETKESRAGKFREYIHVCFPRNEFKEVRDGGVENVLFETLKAEKRVAAVMKSTLAAKLFSRMRFKLCSSYMSTQLESLID